MLLHIGDEVRIRYSNYGLGRIFAGSHRAASSARPRCDPTSRPTIAAALHRVLTVLKLASETGAQALHRTKFEGIGGRCALFEHRAFRTSCELCWRDLKLDFVNL